VSQSLKLTLSALCGLLGPIVLIASFQINPAPPASSTATQLMEFAAQHYATIILGGWMQAVGSILLVLFALSIVYFARATGRLSGLITVMAAACILMVSLLEITFYLTAAQALVDRDEALGTSANAVVKSVQHVFLLSPALLLPVGYILVSTRLLPPVLGYLSIFIGAVLQILGPIGIFAPLQGLIDVILIVQALWFAAAGILLFAGRNRIAEMR